MWVARDAGVCLVLVSPRLVWRVGLPGEPDCCHEHACQTRYFSEAAVDAAEMNELLRDARVIALPSRAEGMPIVLAEAMSVGRPVVSTPVGGIHEHAADGGMFAEVGDAAGLADRLMALLSDSALARRIGERGRRFCLQTRSVEAD